MDIISFGNEPKFTLSGDGTITITAGRSIDCSMKLYFKFEWDFFSFTDIYIKFYLTIDWSVQVWFDAEFIGTIVVEIEKLLSFGQYFSFWIGPVPVIMKPFIQIDAKLETIPIRVYTGFECYYGETYIIGYEYEQKWVWAWFNSGIKTTQNQIHSRSPNENNQCTKTFDVSVVNDDDEDCPISELGFDIQVSLMIGVNLYSFIIVYGKGVLDVPFRINVPEFNDTICDYASSSCSNTLLASFNYGPMDLSFYFGYWVGFDLGETIEMLIGGGDLDIDDFDIDILDNEHLIGTIEILPKTNLGCITLNGIFSTLNTYYKQQCCDDYYLIDPTSTDEYAIVTLTLDPRNINTNTGNYWQVFQSYDNPLYDWALKLNLAGEKYSFKPNIDESSITISIDGECETNECDVYFAFGIGSNQQYLTFTTDLDNGQAVSGANLGRRQGILIYPNCQIKNSSIATGDPSTLIPTDELKYQSIRSALSGGDVDNFQLLTTTANGENFPITFQFENNDILDTFIFRFSSPTFSDNNILECQYDSSVATGGDFNLYLSPDGDNEILRIKTIEINGVSTGYTPTTSYPTNWQIMSALSLPFQQIDDPTGYTTTQPTPSPTLSDDDYPSFIQVNAYASSGQYWFEGQEYNDKKVWREEGRPETDERYIYWTGSKWKIHKSVPSDYQFAECYNDNLFECNVIEEDRTPSVRFRIEYCVFANQSTDEYFIINEILFNGRWIFQAVNKDRFIYYFINDQQWKITNIDKNIIYATCDNQNPFNCNSGISFQSCSTTANPTTADPTTSDPTTADPTTVPTIYNDAVDICYEYSTVILYCFSNITLDPGNCYDTTTFEITDEFIIEFDLKMNTLNGGGSDNYIHIFDIGNILFVRYGETNGLYLRYYSPDGSLQDVIKPINQNIEISVNYKHKIGITRTNLTWQINGISALNVNKQQHETGNIDTLCFPAAIGNGISSGGKAQVSLFKITTSNPTTFLATTSSPTTNSTDNLTTTNTRTSADVVAICDQDGTYYVSRDNGITYTEIASDTIWNQITEFTVDEVDSNTILKYKCKNVEGKGGVVSTIYFNGKEYYTTDPIDDGYFETDEQVLENYQRDDVNTDGLNENAYWIWNGKEYNTMEIYFNFSRVLSDDYHDITTVSLTTANPTTSDPTTAPTSSPTLSQDDYPIHVLIDAYGSRGNVEYWYEGERYNGKRVYQGYKGSSISNKHAIWWNSAQSRWLISYWAGGGSYTGCSLDNLFECNDNANYISGATIGIKVIYCIIANQSNDEYIINGTYNGRWIFKAENINRYIHYCINDQEWKITDKDRNIIYATCNNQNIFHCNSSQISFQPCLTTTDVPSTSIPTTRSPTTSEPTTAIPTTAAPITANPTTTDTSTSADVVAICDQDGTYYVSRDNGITYTEIASDTIWNQITEFTVNEVDSHTILKYKCKNVEGKGGVVSTIYVDGKEYYTTDPIEDGYFETDEQELENYQRDDVNTDGLNENSYWIWNGKEYNTMEMYFNFSRVLTDDYHDITTVNPTTANPTIAEHIDNGAVVDACSLGGIIATLSCSSTITLDPGYCYNTTIFEITDRFIIEFDLTMNTLNGGNNGNFIHIFDIGDILFVRYGENAGGLYLRYYSPDGSLQDALKPINQSIEIDVSYNHKIEMTQTNVTWEINGISALSANKQQHETGNIDILCFPAAIGNGRLSGDKGQISNFKITTTNWQIMSALYLPFQQIDDSENGKKYGLSLSWMVILSFIFVMIFIMSIVNMISCYKHLNQSLFSRREVVQYSKV